MPGRDVLRAIETRQTTESPRATTRRPDTRRVIRAIQLGLLCRRAITVSDDRMYSVSAPNTAIRMMSPVLPVSSAIIPMPMLRSSAITGVRVRAWISPSAAGAMRARPISRSARLAAIRMPWNDATSPTSPMPVSTTNSGLPRDTTCEIASGSGESLVWPSAV